MLTLYDFKTVEVNSDNITIDIAMCIVASIEYLIQSSRLKVRANNINPIGIRYIAYFLKKFLFRAAIVKNENGMNNSITPELTTTPIKPKKSKAE